MAETVQGDSIINTTGPPLYHEDDLVMISALQHYLFCPRQCGLIHIEQVWAENQFTAEGRILHERVHTSGRESRRTLRIEYDVPIRSLRLGLTGRADIVEFHRQDDGRWQPLPVEYKRGRPKRDDSDRVQLCAQALCLEEVLACAVPMGALYYGEKRRRFEVVFDQPLRQAVEQTAHQVQAMLAGGVTPAPRYDARCERCSLLELCLPKVAVRKQVNRYLRAMTTP